MKCIYCGKSFDYKTKKHMSSALKNHQHRCSKNPNRVLQKCSEEKIEQWKKKISENTIKYYSNPENRKKFSERMKQVVLENPESYSDKNIVGRTKHFTIDGIRYNSSWEYEVAQYLSESNVKWKRSKIEPEKYFWNNSWHFYFPDFYLEDYDCYIEVKGYETDRDREKWKQSKKKVIVIKQKELDLIRLKKYDLTEHTEI